MPDRIAAALDRQTAGMLRLAGAFDKSRRLAKTILILGLIELVAVILSLSTIFVVLHSQSDTHKTLRIIQNATSSKTQNQQNKSTKNAVSQITVCTDNHTDRALAVYFHHPIPPRTGGCDPDDLP